jgi:hypothetical protein
VPLQLRRFTLAASAVDCKLMLAGLVLLLSVAARESGVNAAVICRRRHDFPRRLHLRGFSALGSVSRAGAQPSINLAYFARPLSNDSTRFASGLNPT